ncbi:DUF2812 domain-containing protein [Bacillus sp. NTK074B]|uniref:DUF2812 domain-containing protein n=1 Tax=Bacillus sp. NTK074B TaxID=2802174 RepID=UPI001A903F23|nr:DUF2812 domain-containing protein [Bacillus sp. NTK074B]
MKKVKWFISIEKEERWLNEQLQKGYRCTNISGLGVYTFEKTDKNYVMRLDYQDYLSKKKLEEYKGIYEDFGWNYLKGYWLSGIRYWQKESDDQNEIFSDRESKRHYYKRIMGYAFWVGMIFLIYSFRYYRDPGLYHDGLWSMEKDLFWKAFLFETPFVLLKLFPAFMLMLMAGVYYKAYRKYSVLKEQ